MGLEETRGDFLVSTEEQMAFQEAVISTVWNLQFFKGGMKNFQWTDGYNSDSINSWESKLIN